MHFDDESWHGSSYAFMAELAFCMDSILCIYTDTDTDISQHTPYQGFSVTGYIMNR